MNFFLYFVQNSFQSEKRLKPSEDRQKFKDLFHYLLLWQPCDNPWLTVFHGSPKINSLGGVEGDEHQGEDDDAGPEDDGHGYQVNTN